MARTRPQFVLSVGKRILIVLMILFGMMIGILEFAEGMKDPLRLGLQDYLSKVSGDHPAEITKVEKSELFPQIEFTLDGVVIRDKEDRAKTLVSAGRVEVAMSFWKTFLGLADYRVFKIEKADFATGYILPKKLSLNFSGISDPSPGSAPPYFVFDGRYNERPLLITAEMQRKGKKTIHYDFAAEFPVTFKLGDTEAVARFRRGMASIDFAQMSITHGDRKMLLRTEGMEFDPLHIRFIGEMDENPLAGELEQSGDDYSLYIVPGSENPQFLANLTAFVEDVRKDLGLEGEKDHIKIEIRPANVAQQGTENTKEQSPE